jgi:alkylation response protein AidB-like acyl-CoA dehydrogenase/predicted heme/steroid binding protein
MTDRVISMAEVRQHNTATDAWLAIDGDVYDVSKFIKYHPGGAALLAAHAGTEATEAFFDMHKTEVLRRYQRLRIGRLESAKPDRNRAVDQYAPGTLSKVPYAEPAHLQGWKSPVQTEKHKNFRIALRTWYDNNIRDMAAKAGASNKTPSLKLFQKMGKAGILACQLAPGKELTEACKAAGISLPGGFAWEEFDLFMEQIAHEEHARIGVPGFVDGLAAGFSIGAPTLVHFGTPRMKKEVLSEVLLGNKRICLAITEPFAGSDVANIKCTATKTPDGKHYIVNGVKKWITGGLDSDYFITAVRTGGKGMRGMTLLLVERTEGLTTKLIKTSYSAAAGTAYVTMENVLVPVENVLGREGGGFACIMKNFNHERWMIIVNVLAQCRLVLTDCILWANQRKVFGKKLMSQPVIQAKISEMAAQTEALSAWLDTVTYQMQYMNYEDQSKNLAGPIALLKFYSTRVANLVRDHSSQVFGGRAITRTGMGQNIERFARASKYTAIYGGSEEIMQSLAAKQMLKRMPPNSRL